MIPAAFDYHRPDTLDEALKLLKKHGDEAKVLSGGMSLLPMLKLRLASFAHLVDINRVPGLDYIKEEKGTLRIGAMTRQAAPEHSDPAREKRRRVRQAEAQDRRLRRRRSGGAVDAGQERRGREGRYRAHQRRPDADRGGRRGEVSGRQDSGRKDHRGSGEDGRGEELTLRRPARLGRVHKGNGPRSDAPRTAQSGPAPGR